MVQLNLPQSSKIEVGSYYKDKTNSKNLKKVNIYRWDPSTKKNPRVDTFEVDMDNCGPKVLDILFKISERSLGSSDSLTVDITSGYRTKKTNSYLRTVSKNVAKNSLHMKGKAIDFSISGVSNGKLNNIAKDYAVGGLGVYKNFVHIDSGPFRRWSS